MQQSPSGFSPTVTNNEKVIEMFSLKECTCGATTFKILVDTNIRVACTKCGGFFSDLDQLNDIKLQDVNFQLRPA